MVFLFGWFLMKRLDQFLAEKRIPGQPGGFGSPDLCPSV